MRQNEDMTGVGGFLEQAPEQREIGIRGIEIDDDIRIRTLPETEGRAAGVVTTRSDLAVTLHAR